MAPVFAVVAGALMEKSKPPAQYLLLIATCLVTLAIGLISSLPSGKKTPPAVYAYQVILGAGLGAILPSGYMLLKIHVPDADLAAATGVTNFARAMGGTIGVSICTALFHDALNENLPGILSDAQLAAIKESLSNLAHLTPSQAKPVRQIFASAYNHQFRVMLAFAAANVLVAVWLVIAVRRQENPQDALVHEPELATKSKANNAT